METAFGAVVVEADFEKWCEEIRDNHPRYPVSEYLKVINARLGPESKENDIDPGVGEISALTYKLTHRPAPSIAVRELLAQFNIAEIAAALIEYVEGLEERELAYAPRVFFNDGGCAAVISARKSREQDRLDAMKRDAEEKTLIDSLVEKERVKSDEEDRVREAKNTEPGPTVEELFGRSLEVK